MSSSQTQSSIGASKSQIDYTKLKLDKSYDGSECGKKMIHPLNVAICPTTGNVYVHDSDGRTVYTFSGDTCEFIQKIELDYQPTGIAINSKGSIYVANVDSHQICIYDEKLNMKAVGSFGAAKDQFHCPCAVTCDSRDTIYVADKNNKRIQVLNSDGEFIQNFGDTVLSGPARVHIQHNHPTKHHEVILVTDIVENRISVFSLQGEHICNFGDDVENGKLTKPRGLCTDIDGNILVGDYVTKSINIYTSDYRHVYTASNFNDVFNNVAGLAITARGLIIATDGKLGKVNILSS